MSLALADELFLIGHDLQTGRPKVPEHPLGIGLSAALLAELVFAGTLVISQGQLGMGGYQPPPEKLVRALVDQVGKELVEGPVPVPDWLAAHWRLVHELVADRLIRAGELRREQTRRFGRTTTRYRPSQPSEAFMRTQRLGSFLRHRIEIQEPEAVLAVLVSVMCPGPGPLELDAAAQDYLDQLRHRISPQLRDLVAAAEVAVSAGVRGHRV